MPYYEIRLRGGDVATNLEYRELLRGRPIDYTPPTNVFLVEGDCDIDEMRFRAENAAPPGTTATVTEVTERDYNWQRYQRSRPRRG